MLRWSVLCLAVLAAPAAADVPTIERVEVSQGADGWRFDVTISHPDTGREHYADGWEVLGPDGNRLGYRELTHPHVNEQPFTRSLSGVEIPADVSHVAVRAHGNQDGWSRPTRVALPTTDGTD